MPITIANNLTDTSASLRPAQSTGLNQTAVKTSDSRSPPPLPSSKTSLTTTTQISGTKQVSDNIESLDNGGYRRTRVFEQENSRKFSRLEEVTFAANKISKTVIQQNPSGSITRYEDILDRKADGTFNRTQRFQDGTGDVSTQITADYTPKDPFILTSGKSPITQNPAPFSHIRGTQLDLSA